MAVERYRDRNWGPVWELVITVRELVIAVQELFLYSGIAFIQSLIFPV